MFDVRRLVINFRFYYRSAADEVIESNNALCGHAGAGVLCQPGTPATH